MSALNISSFIWGIADDVLRDVYVRGKYRDVILPMTVIRRLDVVLEPTKDEVLRMKEQLDDAGITNQDSALRQASGEAFYNTSPFRLRDLTSRGRLQQLQADFAAYLDGFSPNVQEVLEKFKFQNQVPTLVEADALGFLLEKFLDPSINLSPRPVLNGDGSVRLDGLDNHGMGTVFEELIRRFNEENNEEAGEHFTPRDVVQLMARLVFLPVAEDVRSGTYLVYDGEFALIGRQGALCGNVHIARGKFWATEHAVAATLDVGHDIDWFGAVLTAMNLNQHSIAAAQPGLAVERVLNLHLPVPSKPEQQQIAGRLEGATRGIEAAIAGSRQQIELMGEYRARLVADVVTGKLDVREAADLLPDQDIGDGWPEDGPPADFLGDDDGIPQGPTAIEGEVAR